MNYYEPSNIEYMVSCIYEEHGIFEPPDLEIHNVAKKLHIELVYSDHRSYAYEDEYIRIINIQNGLSKKKQREVFYHELCHLLMHAGDQTTPYVRRFRNQQEMEVSRAMLFASIPYHMLSKIDLKSPTIVTDLAHEFSTSEELAYYRLEHIYENLKVNLY